MEGVITLKSNFMKFYFSWNFADASAKFRKNKTLAKISKFTEDHKEL